MISVSTEQQVQSGFSAFLWPAMSVLSAYIYFGLFSLQKKCEIHGFMCKIRYLIVKCLKTTCAHM